MEEVEEDDDDDDKMEEKEKEEDCTGLKRKKRYSDIC